MDEKMEAQRELRVGSLVEVPQQVSSALNTRLLATCSAPAAEAVQMFTSETPTLRSCFESGH